MYMILYLTFLSYLHASKHIEIFRWTVQEIIFRFITMYVIITFVTIVIVADHLFKKCDVGGG